jgi:hypothetical protein
MIDFTKNLKKFTLLLGFFNLFFLIVKAQEPVPMLLKNGRYAFVNPKTKDLVFDIQFEDARPFSEGFAFVKSRSKWGIIDYNGEYVLPPSYLFLTEIVKGGLFGGTQDQLLYDKNKWEFNNFIVDDSFGVNDNLKLDNFCNKAQNCKFITSINYNFTEDDYYIIEKDRIFYIVKTPRETLSTFPKNFDEGFFFTDVMRSYRNNHGHYSDDYYFDYGIKDYKNGYFQVVRPSSSSQSEFIDYLSPFSPSKGLIGEDYYQQVPNVKVVDEKIDGDFREGLALVYKRGEIGWGGLDGKYGYINQRGEEIVPLRYENLGLFHDGFAIAQLNGNKGYINQKGEFLFTPSDKFELYNFNEGLALVGEKIPGKNSVAYVINKNGDKVFSFPMYIYLGDLQKFSDGKIIYPTINDSDGYKYFVYDSLGNILFKLNFPFVLGFSDDGYAIVGDSNYSGPFNLISAIDGEKFSSSKFDKMYLISTDTFGSKINTSDFKHLNRDLFQKHLDITKTNLFWNELIFVERSGFKFYVDKDGFEYIE